MMVEPGRNWEVREGSSMVRRSGRQERLRRQGKDREARRLRRGVGQRKESPDKDIIAQRQAQRSEGYLG